MSTMVHIPVRVKPLEIEVDRKSTRLNSSHLVISYAVFCLKKKKIASSNERAKNIIMVCMTFPVSLSRIPLQTLVLTVCMELRQPYGTHVRCGLDAGLYLEL